VPDLYTLCMGTVFVSEGRATHLRGLSILGDEAIAPFSWATGLLIHKSGQWGQALVAHACNPWEAEIRRIKV
jgi:hypothetical protein